jgi:hypothetical protein
MPHRTRNSAAPIYASLVTAIAILLIATAASRRTSYTPAARQLRLPSMRMEHNADGVAGMWSRPPLPRC